MADTTATATAAANKAAEKVAERAAERAAEKAAVKFAENVAAARAVETLPTVVETAELAMQVPSKVVLNQKLIVVAAILGGMALGAGTLYGINKIRERKLREKLAQEAQAAVEAAQNNGPKNQ